MSHADNHDNKMCAITCCPCDLDLEVIKRTANNPNYICSACGHVANEAENLCQPESMS